MSGLGLKLIMATASTSLAHAASQIVDVAVSSDGSASSVYTDGITSVLRGEQEVLETKAAPTSGAKQSPMETVRTQPSKFDTPSEEGPTQTLEEPVNQMKCAGMPFNAQMVRMAMSAYNVGTLPLGGTTEESGLLFRSWQLEENSANPFLGSAPEFWKEVGMSGTSDLWSECGWDEVFMGCFKSMYSDQPCHPNETLISPQGFRIPNIPEIRNYMAIYRNKNGNKYVQPNSCTIAFSGSNDEADVILAELPNQDVSARIQGLPRANHTLKLFTPKVSGVEEGAYGGFITAYKAYEAYSGFQNEWLSLVQSDKCQHIYMTGHNLGGSIAMLHRIDYADYDAEKKFYKSTCFGKECAFVVFGVAPPFYRNLPVEDHNPTGLKSMSTPGCGDEWTIDCGALCGDPVNRPWECDPVILNTPKFGDSCGATKDKHIYLQDDVLPFSWAARNSDFRWAFGNWEYWNHGENVAQFKLFRKVASGPFMFERIVPILLVHNCENVPWDISRWKNFSSNVHFRENGHGSSIYSFPSVLDIAEGFEYKKYGNVTPSWAEGYQRLSDLPPGSFAYTMYFFRHAPGGVLRALVDIPSRMFSRVWDAVGR